MVRNPKCVFSRNSIIYLWINMLTMCRKVLVTVLLILFFSYMCGTQEELDKEQLTLLKNAFDAFDHEKKGMISTDMIGTILEMLGHELDEGTLNEIIAEVDQTGSGQLEFKDFCNLAGRFLTEEEEDNDALVAELREAFRMYDREGNGYITTDVLKEIFRELDNTITADDLDSMIQEIDTDGSGTVDFDEFIEVMAGE